MNKSIQHFQENDRLLKKEMVANLDNVKIDDIITLHCQDWRVYNEKNRKESSDGHIILDISTSASFFYLVHDEPRQDTDLRRPKEPVGKVCDGYKRQSQRFFY